jgi:hypothetical protein
LLANFRLFVVIWDDAYLYKFLAGVLSLLNFDRVAVPLLRELPAGKPKLSFHFDILNLGA